MKVLYIVIWIVLFAWGDSSVSLWAQRIEKSRSVSTVEDSKPDTLSISAYDNVIVVEHAPVGSKLEIYSVVGIRVKEIEIKQPSGEYPVSIAKGYYIVRIGDTVRKVSIR